MEKEIAKEIQRLKEELHKKKEEIRDIKRLVNKEIDREFHTDLGELSERELETYIGECLSSINRNIESKLEKVSLTSHRKILGKPIILIKRALLRITGVYSYINPFLDKQTEINQQFASLHQALLFLLRKNRDRMKQIEEEISNYDENLVIIMEKIRDLHLSLEQLKK